MAKAIAPGVVYLVGDKPFFDRANTILAAISSGVIAEVRVRSRDKKRVEAFTSDNEYRIIYDSKRLTIIKGGGRAKKILRPVIISALKTMDFLEAKASLDITLTYSPSYPIVAMPTPTFSTATALATSLTIGGDKLDKDDLWKIAFETERIIKKIVISSLITTIIEGGVIVERWGRRVSKFSPPDLDEYTLLLIHSGREGQKGIQLPSFWSIKTHYDNYMEYLGYSINSLATEIIETLVKKDIPRFAKLLNLSHSLLRAVNASTFRADDLVTTALRLGAIGAKLVKLNDGFVIAITHNKKLESLRSAMEKRSRVVRKTVFSADGVKAL